MTGIDGNYEIEVDSSHTTLVFSYCDFKTQEINIGNDSVINVTLEREDIYINELLLVAFFTPPRTEVVEITKDSITVLWSHKAKFLGFEKQGDWGWLTENFNFFKYIFDRISYPEPLAEKGIDCRVLVRFKIDLYGNIEDIELLRACDELADLKVLSAVRNAPKLSRDEVVRLLPQTAHLNYIPPFPWRFVLPVSFRINYQ